MIHHYYFGEVVVLVVFVGHLFVGHLFVGHLFVGHLFVGHLDLCLDGDLY